MEFVLDASFTLHWCFEDEATSESDAVLTRLQNQTDSASVPGIWPHELLNGLGKGIMRSRVDRQKAFSLWQEIRALPIRIIDVPVNEALLELALQRNIAVYDASYLSLAVSRNLPLATGEDKLIAAAQSVGVHILRP